MRRKSRCVLKFRQPLSKKRGLLMSKDKKKKSYSNNSSNKMLPTGRSPRAPCLSFRVKFRKELASNKITSTSGFLQRDAQQLQNVRVHTNFGTVKVLPPTKMRHTVFALMRP
jgi:hypothetical protein